MAGFIKLFYANPAVGFQSLANKYRTALEAGQVIAEAAGDTVRRHDTGQPLRYNKEDLLNPWHIVTRKMAKRIEQSA